MFFPHGHAHVWVRTRHLHALAGPLRQHLRKAAEDGRNHGGKHGGKPWRMWFFMVFLPNIGGFFQPTSPA